MSETCVCGAEAKWIVAGGWLHNKYSMVIAYQCHACYEHTCATNEMNGARGEKGKTLGYRVDWTYHVDEHVAAPL